MNGGDGFIFVVEFGDAPEAYSVLAYGQSGDPDSPHYDDQTALFCNNQMKRVAFTEHAIENQLIRKYRPEVVRASELASDAH
jgi:acyl-homoserine-lactone acylase